mmetsp:Transcript_34165/g.63330  ORF Transcript_34165/g.63330 Transcript_34165/m.63330 type:complete len:529 (-) Transcript_34165:143-1729(-)|eukprot:CAMPEP_0170169264 /NCGR_PEP_ID=MMETSP0040_2-20121228/2174_1 /TAXON_ID=641309 /ORGANISM="Lotharella oceanica, Strain CCMP622" /LENGTH=528 /DNA_ID=CAMNT_0010407895 /DNA_START=70 /DNA_END=1656 /DNA_ORIENTATION=-
MAEGKEGNAWLLSDEKSEKPGDLERDQLEPKEEANVISRTSEEHEADKCETVCLGKTFTCSRHNITWTVIWSLVIMTGFSTIAISVDYAVRGKQSKHIVAWYSAGIFVILAVSLSLYEIFMHLANFSNPQLQRYIVRILWMVPIYAIESWFSLRFKSQAVYLETAREAYEAYVIYNFLYLLLAYLGGEKKIIRESLRRNQPEKEHHLWPFNYMLPQWRTGKQFLVRCKLGTLQYVVLKVMISVITFILESSGDYDEGNLHPDGAYLWIALANNFSQIYAMYCLVLFYHAYHDELEGLRPLSKFICVKAVVFFSFWQQVLIAILVKEDVIHESFDYSKDDLNRGCQDYLICIEMLIAAVAHTFSFSHKEYIVRIVNEHAVLETQKRPLIQAFIESSIPGEAIEDTVRMGRGMGRAIAQYGHTAIQGAGQAVSIVHTRVRKIGERVVSRNVVVEEISVPTINEEFVHVDMSDVPAAAESDVLPVESKELQLQSSNEYEASEEVQKQNVKLEEKELGENSRAETDYSSPAE